jgi:hypothetical protein
VLGDLERTSKKIECPRKGGGVGVGERRHREEGGGMGGEVAQTMYKHMNKYKTIKN